MGVAIAIGVIVPVGRRRPIALERVMSFLLLLAEDHERSILVALVNHLRTVRGWGGPWPVHRTSFLADTHLQQVCYYVTGCREDMAPTDQGRHDKCVGVTQDVALDRKEEKGHQGEQ